MRTAARKKEPTLFEWSQPQINNETPNDDVTFVDGGPIYYSFEKEMLFLKLKPERLR